MRLAAALAINDPSDSQARRTAQLRTVAFKRARLPTIRRSAGSGATRMPANPARA
jgi:hypothetical protein